MFENVHQRILESLILTMEQCSSFSSFELFVIMQEDVYIGHTALALTLGLQVFS